MFQFYFWKFKIISDFLVLFYSKVEQYFEAKVINRKSVIRSDLEPVTFFNLTKWKKVTKLPTTVSTTKRPQKTLIILEKNQVFSTCKSLY